MIAPHTSCRYAVVFAEAFEPGADGYVIAAVHGIAEDTPMALLVSRVSTVQAPLAFSPPTWVLASRVLRLGANYKDASALRAHLVEEDHRAEQFYRPCANHPDRKATVAYAPNTYLCNDCAVDAQRDEYNRDEAIR